MITEVKFLQRFNKGNYEHEEYGITYAVDDGESAEQALFHIKELVSNSFKGVTAKEEVPCKEVVPTKEEESTVAGKPEKEEEVKVVETEKEFKKETKKKKAPKNKKSYKNTPYNREVTEHTKELASILGKVSPKWKASAESKAKAKALSESLVGEPFLNTNEGTVLDSFIKLVAVGMSAEL